MTKKKANVTPNDVGRLYIGDDGIVYRLTSCDIEPIAVMEIVGKEGKDLGLLRPISEFADFVRLKPERPIVKPPTPRKPRSDRGTHRGREAEAEAHTHGSIDISTFKMKTDKDGYTLSLGDVSVVALTLKEGVRDLFASHGIDQEYVESSPDSEGKQHLLDILKGGD